jgi:Mg2+/Co2+ transporter CorB
MKVKDLMIPISECARVTEDRSVLDAIMMLEASRRRLDRLDYRMRVVLVYDEQFNIIGSLRHLDILRAFAPGGEPPGAKPESDTEVAPDTSVSCSEDLPQWQRALAGMFEIARKLRVKDVMYRYSESEYIDEDAPLEEALCRLVTGPYLNLVVRSAAVTAGILRMSDVFATVWRAIQKSGLR